MNRISFACLTLLKCVSLATLFPEPVAAGGPTIIYGPGVRPLIYETQDVDYHVLDGTQITSPSRTGPPEDFVVVTDAIEFRGGGHIQIDGGIFQGGDASYTGVNGDLATVVAGAALHLRQSSGEVFGGTFIGGQATSSTWLGSTSGGHGLVLVESTITIHGGYFEGGVSRQPDLFGGLRIMQEPGIMAHSGSHVLMYGGQVNGDIFLSGASLSVFGFNFSYDGTRLSGNYPNGTPFNHTVRDRGGVFLNIVPEPSAALLVVVAGCMTVILRPRSTAWLHFNGRINSKSVVSRRLEKD